MFITRRHLHRRTVLKGLGATIALPFLDAMSPAGTAWANDAASARKLRLIAMEMVHGAAGSTAFGLKKNLWSPAEAGSRFDLSPTSLAALEPYRDYLTIVSNTDIRNAEAFVPKEIGGDHFRSAAVFLTQSHPHQTQGSDLQAGTSLDQIYAKKFGQETPIPSMQLCIENVDQAGGCFYGYSCAYTDSISWASPSEPLPMIRDPRAVFDQLFGVGATPAARVGAPPPRPQHPRLGHRIGRPAEGDDRRRRPRAPRRLPHGRARDRAPHPEGGGAQHERRSARTADGAQRRARFVR